MNRPRHSLKRLLVPIWNAANHASRNALEIAASLLRGRFERCAVCGKWSIMVFRARVVARRLVEMWGLTRRQARALRRKESLDCLRCGAKLRARRLAQVITLTFCDDPERPPPSLLAWAATRRAQGLAIAEVNRIAGVHEALATLPALRYSDYETAGVPSEDLTRLSYGDNTLDLMLTSETLEHVPDLRGALREIRRVLKPGGVHIFTIPMMARVDQTYARAQISLGGQIEPIAGVLLKHPGGDVGYPVFTEFGLDFVDILHDAGFDVQLNFLPVSDDDVAQVWLTKKVR